MHKLLKYKQKKQAAVTDRYTEMEKDSRKFISNYVPETKPDSSKNNSGGTTITHEKEVTVSEVVYEGCQMFIKCVERMRKFDSDIRSQVAVDLTMTQDKVYSMYTTELSKLMSDIREQHPQFCTSYPIVLRYMIEYGQFKPDALKKYINYVKVNPWKDEEVYINSQAEYVVFLYKETKSHYSASDVNKVRQEIRKILMSEHKEFKDTLEKNKKEVEEKEARLNSDRDNEFLEFLSANRDEILRSLEHETTEGNQ